jgi:peroxiredoxin/predicted negative regulator of RcsB-dependent stress response
VCLERLVKVFIPFLVAGAILAGHCHAAMAFRNVKEGDPAPGFTLKDDKGQDYALSSLAGKVVVVIFVKPDQQNSVLALRDLQKIYPTLSPKGAVFLAVVSEADQKDKAAEVARQEKITFPVLFDDGRKVYGDWGAFLYPTTGIVGKDGKLAAQVPSHDWKYQDAVEGNIQLALGEITKEQLESRLNPKENEKADPGKAKAERHMMLADQLLARKLTDKACTELAQAVEAAPELTSAHIKFGYALLHKGDTAKALEQFQTAVQQNPRSSDAKTGLGACLVAGGQVDKGLQLLIESVKDNPRPARANFELGKAYEKKGTFDKAAEHYRKAAEELATW